MEKFKTPEDLLHFVLEVCGGMTGYLHHNDQLIITDGFNIERIFYFIYLLEEEFGVVIKELDITNRDIMEIEEGYLENTKLEKLSVFDNLLSYLPKLPPTLKELLIDNNNFSTFPELHEGMEKIRCFQNSFTEIGYIPDSLNLLNVGFVDPDFKREYKELYNNIINHPDFIDSDRVYGKYIKNANLY